MKTTGAAQQPGAADAHHPAPPPGASAAPAPAPVPPVGADTPATHMCQHMMAAMSGMPMAGGAAPMDPTADDIRRPLTRRVAAGAQWSSRNLMSSPASGRSHSRGP